MKKTQEIEGLTLEQCIERINSHLAYSVKQVFRLKYADNFDEHAAPEFDGYIFAGSVESLLYDIYTVEAKAVLICQPVLLNFVVYGAGMDYLAGYSLSAVRALCKKKTRNQKLTIKCVGEMSSNYN